MTILKSQSINRKSTLFLRLVIILVGIGVAGLCAYMLFISIISNEVGAYRPIFLGMCIAAIPFFFGINQALNLLEYIDRNEAFSDLSVKALRKIKLNALVISAMYAAGMPYIVYVADIDDAPGVIFIGLILVAAPIAIAVFAAILQQLFESAMNIKSENDLTV